MTNPIPVGLIEYRNENCPPRPLTFLYSNYSKFNRKSK